MLEVYDIIRYFIVLLAINLSIQLTANFKSFEDEAWRRFYFEKHVFPTFEKIILKVDFELEDAKINKR